jgi:prolycopene isomerase
MVAHGQEDEMQNTYDVIIVGAGPGGSACAGLLAKKGMKVLLLDKNERPGGKMMTFSRDGFKYELFPITGMPAKNSSYEVVLKELGMEKEVELYLPDPAGLFYYRSPSGEVRSLTIPGKGRAANPFKMTTWLGIKKRHWFKSLRFLVKVVRGMKEHEIDALDTVSAQEFLLDQDIPYPLYSFFANMLSVGLVEAPIDVACASEFVRVFRQGQKCGGGRYASGGYGRVFEVFAEGAKKYGADVLMKTRVEKILVQDGAVTGVVTKEGVFSAPIVVSNGGIQPTVLKLVGEEHFDKSYVNYVKGLVAGTSYCGYRAIVNKPVLKYSYSVYFSDKSIVTTDTVRRAREGQMAEEVCVWVGTNSVFPDMAPPGKQLIHMCTACTSDPGTNLQPYLQKLDEIVNKVWPDIAQHTESREVFGPANVPFVGNDHVLPGQGGEAYGLGQVVGQCGKYKPSAKAPVRGLFYVGFPTEGSGVGSHQAVDSGINVAKMVYDYHLIHAWELRQGLQYAAGQK